MLTMSFSETARASSGRIHMVLADFNADDLCSLAIAEGSPCRDAVGLESPVRERASLESSTMTNTLLWS